MITCQCHSVNRFSNAFLSTRSNCFQKSKKRSYHISHGPLFWGSLQWCHEETAILQQGHWEWLSSQGTKHLEWNRWVHGRCIRVSPALNESRQTAHSSWSVAFQLSLPQLNLFVPPPFFTPFPGTTSLLNWVSPSCSLVLMPSAFDLAIPTRQTQRP